MRIAILGSGQVGPSLARGYRSHGHDVTIGTRKSEVEDFAVGPPAEVVASADLVVLAVHGSIAADLVAELAAPLDGKILVDATNPLDFSSGAPGLFVGFDDSLGERVQRAAPGARVVKAYNTVGNAQMVDPEFADGPPTMFLAGNDDDAKATVVALLQETGWDSADLGGIEASRYLEPMCLAWVLYGIRNNVWGHAFKLLRA
ncbi:MAG TPA: NAD(P)-binding domain-containing protein [Frankiaceae bacterium]|nr:NAD(P)-binding domain-containing protein [Frankiaceae bacterium]